MINFNDIVRKSVEENNLNWSQIFDQSYIMLIIWSSVSGKTNPLVNLISHQQDIDKKESNLKQNNNC